MSVVGMSVVRFQRLSMAEAEGVMAEICGCLEEYDVAMPEMAFGFHGRSRVSVTVRIDDPIAAILVNLRLASWFAARGRPRRISGGVAAATAASA